MASIINSEEARLWAALENLIFGSSSGEQRIAGLLLQFPLMLLVMPVLIGLTPGKQIGNGCRKGIGRCGDRGGAPILRFALTEADGPLALGAGQLVRTHIRDRSS